MAHTATRDDVLESCAPHGEHYVVARNGVTYVALGNAGPDALYAVSPRTGVIVYVERTGTYVSRSGEISVKINFPRDTGDAAGTVAFDGGHSNGRTLASRFGR